MLVILASFVALVFGDGTQYSFSDELAIVDRFTIPINTCFDNVTRFSGSYRDGGSTYCICTQGKTLTESGFACFYYEDTGCTGDLLTEEYWGGCETNGDRNYLYTVENCQEAQAYLEDGGECPYWIRDGTRSNIQRKIYPLQQCFDYFCDDTNSNSQSRSCLMQCSGDEISSVEHEDYTCDASVATEDYTAWNNRACGSSTGLDPDCSVTVTTYDILDANFECGSKSSNNHFKTSSKSSKSNYIMLSDDSVPLPIGECATNRYGYYSYSYQYVCSDDGTEVTLRHYLNDDGDCDEEGNVITVETYVSTNTSFKCDGSTSSGKIGYYEGCYDLNWDAKYYEYLTLFGECVPLKGNPLTEAADDFVLGNQPWYENLRIVMSCNLNVRGKSYPSVYLYVTEDCSGDYIFEWDWDNYYSVLSNYGTQACALPQITGCKNSQDSVQRGNLPNKESVCKK